MIGDRLRDSAQGAKKTAVKTAKNLMKSLPISVPTKVTETVKLRALGLTKVPMLFFLSPTVVELDDYRCVVKVPLTRRAKNHLGCMYFGALAAGADCAAGLIAWKLGDEMAAQGRKVQLIFKDFQAEFLKRAEGDVLFTCEEGQAIRRLVEQVALSGQRENLPVHVTATVPSKLGSEPVAKFTLTLSLKGGSSAPKRA